jgi:cytochrome c oxidase subunit 2
MARPLLTLLLALPLAACRSDQSALSPQGDDAAQIAQLTWILLALVAITLGAVIVTLWLAIRGSQDIRAKLAGQRIVIVGGIAFPTLVLTALFGYALWMTRADSRAAEANVQRIEVTGEQWWWRIAYLAPDGTRVVSANELHIPVGRPLEFILKSADVIHSFWIPSLGGKVDMIPGRTTRLQLTATRPGTYRGQCAEYCGGPHALMALEVIASSEAEFAAWLQREAGSAAQPRTEAENRGQQLFVAAGCGACHTVRGSPANGTIGPDLTHLAARRSVAIDTLPLTAANLIRFVADGQHVKPGNTMPPFRIFSASEQDALAAYLLSLR